MNNSEPKYLEFDFTCALPEVRVRPGLRTSVWAEDAPEYCTPCEFQQVAESLAPVRVRAVILDPNDRITDRYVHATFYFGHPGRIVGYGQLVALVGEED
jgi:hypothetical protein